MIELVEMVWSGRIDINMVEMGWNGSNGNGIEMVEMIFPYFSPSFHFSYSSLPFSPPFLSFFLFVFFFSSFHIFFSFSSSLLFFFFAYCNFLEKKKITFEDFT